MFTPVLILHQHPDLSMTRSETRSHRYDMHLDSRFAAHVMNIRSNFTSEEFGQKKSTCSLRLRSSAYPDGTVENYKTAYTVFEKQTSR